MFLVHLSRDINAGRVSWGKLLQECKPLTVKNQPISSGSPETPMFPAKICCILRENINPEALTTLYRHPSVCGSFKTLKLNSLWAPEDFEWSYFSVGWIGAKIQICTFWPKRPKMRESHAKCVRHLVRIVVWVGGSGNSLSCKDLEIHWKCSKIPNNHWGVQYEISLAIVIDDMN